MATWVLYAIDPVYIQQFLDAGFVVFPCLCILISVQGCKYPKVQPGHTTI